MQYNKRYFFKDIVVVVFIVHAILLAMVFLHDTGKFHQERFAVNSHNLESTIVFMPLKKRVMDKNKSTVSGHKKDASRNVLSHDAYEKKVAAQVVKKQKKVKPASKKKVIKPQAVKAPVKKEVPVKVQPVKKSPTMLQQEHKKKIDAAKIAAEKQAVADKAKAKKAAEKKALSVKEQAAKKISEKKIADEKIAIAAAKARADKAAEKKAEKEEKIVPSVEKKAEQEELQSDKIEIPEQGAIYVDPAVTLQENNSISDDDEEDDEDDIDLENVSFVGSHDLEMIQIKEQIQVQIVKYYKPPVGIAKKAICELAVVVGAAGKAERVTVKKSSGSVANDICARAALLKVTFPKEVIGKEIIVELGQ